MYSRFYYQYLSFMKLNQTCAFSRLPDALHPVSEHFHASHEYKHIKIDVHFYSF